MADFIKLNHEKMPSINAEFNAIYQKFPQWFKFILTERFDKDDTYVEMSQQKDLEDLIESNLGRLCLICGSRGIGKSMLVNHIFNKYSQINGFLVLMFDFNRVYDIFEFSNDFFQPPKGLDPDERKIWAYTQVEQFFRNSIYKEIQDRFKEKNKQDMMINDLYDFIKENSKIYAADMPDEPSDEIKRDFIEKKRAEKGGGMPLIYWAIKFYMHKFEKDTLLFIVDNSDLKDAAIIESVIDRLNHLIACFTPDINQQYFGKSFCIVTCRTAVKNKLFQDRANSSLGAYNFEIIQIDRPVEMSKMLEKRLNAYKNEHPDEKFTTDFTIDSIKLRIKDRNETLIRIIEGFKYYGDTIMSFCNYDVSEALKQTIEIIKNKSFINEADYLPHIFAKDKHPSNIALSQVLNCMAYGNPEFNGKFFYPTNDTIIPNILNWNKDESSTFLMKMRIALCLKKNNMTIYSNDRGLSVSVVVEILLKYHNCSFEVILDQIIEMYRQGLVSSYSGLDPDIYDYISLTPKAEEMFTLFGKNSILLEYYVDDTWINVDILGDQIDLFLDGDFTRGSDKAITFQKLMAFFEYIFESEQEFLNSIVLNNLFYEFKKDFDEVLICKMLFKGIKRSYEQFYKPNFLLERRKHSFIHRFNVLVRINNMKIKDLEGILDAYL